MKTRLGSFVGLLVVVALVLAGCGGGDPTVTPGAEPEPQVEGLEVRIMESFPVQVSAVVTGTLPAGCAGLGDPEVLREGDTFHITVPASTEEGAVCTVEPTPFEVVVPLDVLGLEAGTYTVEADGVTETFVLEVDNVLQEG